MRVATRLSKAMAWKPAAAVGLAADNASWLVAGHLLRWIAALFGGVLVARYLGPERFGSYRFVASMVTICIPFWTLGLTSILAKELIEQPREQGSILGTALLLRLVAGVLGSVLLISGVTLLGGSDASIGLYAAIFSVGGCFSCLEALRPWFEIRAAARRIVPAQTVMTYLTAAAKGLLVILQAPFVIFVVVGSIDLAVGGLASLFAFVRQRQSITEFRFKTTLARDLLRRSWPLLLSGLASAVYFKIDQLMLGWLVSYRASGIYAVAATLSEMWYILATVLAASIYPFLIKLKKTNENAYNLRLQQGYDILFMLALALAIATTALARPLVGVLYGTAFAAAAPVLMIHIWAATFMFMRELFGKWLIIEDLYIYALLTHVTAAALNVALNFILIPYAQEIGAAVATVISYAVAGPVSALVFPRTRRAGRMMARAATAPLRVAVRPRAYLAVLGAAGPAGPDGLRS
jgi:O-antigen/teichoic acid export membrane protein